jgi:hypothetical protein
MVLAAGATAWLFAFLWRAQRALSRSRKELSDLMREMEQIKQAANAGSN